VDGVVVILGVGRINGDKSHLAPIFAAGQGRRPRRFGFGKNGAREDMRNIVRMNGDQADSALGLERAEPFDDPAGGEAKSSMPGNLDGDEIAIGCASGCIGSDREFAAKLLLVDRNQPSAAARKRTKNTERTMFCPVDKLDDSTAYFFAGAFDTDERSIADAANFVGAGAAGRGAAGRGNMDDGRRAVGLFVPLGWARDELAITVAPGNVDKDDWRQSSGVMQTFPPPIDATFIGEIAKHALKRRAICILGAERARNLADADLAATLADEIDELLA
jgi:hypothetical protein